MKEAVPRPKQKPAAGQRYRTRAQTHKGRYGSPNAAYAKFFDLWKNADPDVPVLLQAKAEYAALGGATRH